MENGNNILNIDIPRIIKLIVIVENKMEKNIIKNESSSEEIIVQEYILFCISI